MSNCYRPKRSFGQGNIFTPVCHSVHRVGGYPSMPCRSVPGWVGIPACLASQSRGGEVCLQFFGGVSNFLGGLQFSGGLHFGGVKGGPPNFFFFDFWFLWGYPPPGTRHWNTVNVRPVRILLECILVYKKVLVKYTFYVRTFLVTNRIIKSLRGENLYKQKILLPRNFSCTKYCMRVYS